MQSKEDKIYLILTVIGVTDAHAPFVRCYLETLSDEKLNEEYQCALARMREEERLRKAGRSSR
jgi:hypothetical protein